MSDPVLMERLNALEQNLRNLDEDLSCCRVLSFQNLQLSPEILPGLCRALRDEARAHKQGIRDVRENLTRFKDEPKIVKDAWKEYTRVYRQSKQFFRECLEVIGGLALRDMGIQQVIYLVADELIKSCAEDSTIIGPLAPTVPALPETMVKTLARIIGLGFPEWTIWTLPFAAHELGHVVIDYDDDLKAFAEGKAEKWALGKSKKRNKRYLNEYLADSFGTYTMGPAYACSVIRLGFNPSTAYIDKDECPMHAKRAYVVLAVLKRMSKAGAVEGLFEHVHQKLEKSWKDMLIGLGENADLDEQDKHRLDNLVEEILTQFGKYLRPSAMYSAMYCSSKEDVAYGWLVADQWYTTWKEQLTNTKPLNIEELKNLNSLRDVLNAAWRCRLDYSDKPDNIKDVDDVAKAAQDLCEKIIKMKNEPSGDGGAMTMRFKP